MESVLLRESPGARAQGATWGRPIGLLWAGQAWRPAPLILRRGAGGLQQPRTEGLHVLARFAYDAQVRENRRQRAFREECLQQRAADGRGDLEGCLVGLDLRHGLSRGHQVALVLQPIRDRSEE